MFCSCVLQMHIWCCFYLISIRISAVFTELCLRHFTQASMAPHFSSSSFFLFSPPHFLFMPSIILLSASVSSCSPSYSTTSHSSPLFTLFVSTPVGWDQCELFMWGNISMKQLLLFNNSCLSISLENKAFIRNICLYLSILESSFLPSLYKELYKISLFLVCNFADTPSE